MKLIANRQLRGVYGLAAPGQTFDCPDDVAGELLRKQVARIAASPRVQYETKVIVPEAPEVSARQPFRDVPVLDAESPTVAPQSSRVFSTTNLPPLRDADPRGRGGRKGLGSKR
jgi:hypothetical protein